LHEYRKDSHRKINMTDHNHDHKITEGKGGWRKLDDNAQLHGLLFAERPEFERVAGISVAQFIHESDFMTNNRVEIWYNEKARKIELKVVDWKEDVRGCGKDRDTALEKDAKFKDERDDEGGNSGDPGDGTDAEGNGCN
jgi:hypothetical protein